MQFQDVPAVTGSLNPAQVRAKIAALQVGMAASFDGDPRVIRAHAAGIARANRAHFRITEEDGKTIVERVTAPDGPGAGLQATLTAMAVGQTIRLENVRVSSVRATASMAKRLTGDHFAVAAIADGVVHVSRTEGTTRAGRRRYPFDNQHPGSAFTVPSGQHGGIDSLRVLCNRYGEPRGLKFIARQNIDGSITVRCYHQGAIPPKWAQDKEHARMQELIEGTIGEAGETY